MSVELRFGSAITPPATPRRRSASLDHGLTPGAQKELEDFLGSPRLGKDILMRRGVEFRQKRLEEKGRTFSFRHTVTIVMKHLRR